MAVFPGLSGVWRSFCGHFNGPASVADCGEGCKFPLSFGSELLGAFRVSSCAEDALVAGTQVAFLVAFLCILMVKGRGRSGMVANAIWVVAINGILFVVNLGLAFAILQEQWSNGSSVIPLRRWAVLLVQGLAWGALGFTVVLRSTYSVMLFVRIWWITNFLVGTLDCISSGLSLLNGREFSARPVLAVASWPACCLMLACAAKRELKSSEVCSPDLNGALQNGACRNAGLESGRGFVSQRLDSQLSSNITPFAKAGFLSRLSFWWVNPLLRKGWKRPLEEEDVPHLSGADRAEESYVSFAEQLSRLKKKKMAGTPSVMWALALCQRKRLVVTGFFALTKILTQSCGPLVLNAFIGFAQGRRGFRYEGYVLVGALFLAKFLESLSQRHWYFGSRRIGLQMRSSLIAAIYRKQLRLSNEAKHVHSSGEIMNYMAVDAYRIGEFPFWVHQVWTTPLQLVVALSILFYSIGLATISALVVVVLTMLCNSPLAKLQHKFQTALMSAQDERLRATTEALVHMKVLKLHAWEKHFKGVVESMRKAEYKWLKAVQFRKAYNSLLFWTSPILVSTVTFATCYLLGIPLTPSNVFTFVATLRLVQEPIRIFPDVIAVIIQARVSLNRIANFLEAAELQDGAVEQRVRQESEFSLLIDSATLSWNSSPSKPTLRNINMKVKYGQKVAVCGEVGSGKSTLLAAILGEVPKLGGTLQVCGSIAYVSQTAWIQSGTVQDNILFGRPMDKGSYREVIQKSLLEKDLESLPFGDLTEIGERGINLSGGQKQRIQLARALYQDADIYLLDDPLSAVDAHTATSLYKDYIMGALLTKTVILVTHQVDFLPAFDSILLMLDGEIHEAGRYHELLASSEAFQQLVNAHKDTAGSSGPSGTVSAMQSEPVKEDREIQRIRSQKEQRHVGRSSEGSQLIKQEEKEIGDTGLKPYIDYLKQNKGFLYCALAGFAHLTFVTGQIIANTWMAAEVQSFQVSTLLLIIVYSAIGFGSAVFLFLRSICVVILGLQASKSFFSELMTSLFRAPMAFFDSTPLGRVLSRVSVDMSILDLDIPFSFIFTICSTINACSSLGVVAVVTWQVLFAAIPMIYLTIQIQKYYFTSAKELMRINGTTKSPIANHFGESISGAMTIRAFNVENQFFEKNFDLIDKNSSPFFHSFASNEWLIQRLEIMSAVVLSSSALAMVLLPVGTFNPGFVGMALSYGLSLNISLVFSIQNQCTLANYIVSVERIKQYMHIPSEAPEIIEDNRPPRNWPSHGKVELQDLKIRYRCNTPLVLRGITCTFEGGQKIGIVGRTGSGKSTLISAIFRLVEPAGGRILIDGLDIATIGLHDLRSHLGIIPQDPTLFRGTVRYNLDPLSQHSDLAIWEALDKCQLGDIVREKADGLAALVGDDGANWSVGQRQLFCLGRALLRHSRILVLDEATASIDNATDSTLQRTIREEFAECTVITVAHRIPTVMDSDMVVAISDGEMVECDEPLKLMERKGSLFGMLVKEYWSHTSNAVLHAAACQ